MSLFAELLGDFADPAKRIFVGFLISSGIIAILWCRVSRHLFFSDAIRHVFAIKVWWSESARCDYQVFFINGAINTLLAPKMLGQLTVALILFEALHTLFAGRPLAGGGWPPWAVMAMFTLTLFVADDFARYGVHRLLHAVPCLWAFHKVHHSATSLTPITVFRTHPVESVIFILRSTLVQGACIAAFIFFFDDQVQLMTVWGANVFNFCFNALGSNLRHSHIALGYWHPLERIFLSPAQHQIHHSTARAHIDKNFGVTLALWDLVFRTHCHSNRKQELEFGLRGESQMNHHQLKAIYWVPFREAFNTLAGPFYTWIVCQKNCSRHPHRHVQCTGEDGPPNSPIRPARTHPIPVQPRLQSRLARRQFPDAKSFAALGAATVRRTADPPGSSAPPH